MDRSRRRFLRGAGGVVLGLPFLELYTPKARAQPAIPKRLVLVYQTQGLVMDQARPSGTPGGTWQFGPLLSGFETYRDRMTVVTGIDDESCFLDGVNAHERAPAHVFTGAKMAGGQHQLGGAASIDHLISERITDPSVPVRSVHLGVRNPWEPCFTGPSSPVGREKDPQVAFDLLFGGYTSSVDPAAMAALRGRRQSVLDAVKENVGRLEAELGAADQQRLEAYLERVRDLERRLTTTVALGEACVVPTLDLHKSPARQTSAMAVPKFHPYYDFDVAAVAQVEIAAMALACGITQVVTLAYGHSNEYEWLNDAGGSPIVVGDWHSDVVHQGPGTVSAPSVHRPSLLAVQGWEMGEVVRLLGALDAVDEGTGTLLDNCLVVYANEFSDGSSHDHRDKLYFLAGGCGGTAPSRGWLHFGGEPHNRLLLSVLRAFGQGDATFGEASLCADGPLPGLIG